MDQQNKKIAIQGVRGAFHEIAARQFFGEDIAVTPALYFDELARMTAAGEVDGAVMAIENSIAGSILGNYALLRTHGLGICGEVYLRIQQNLMALPDVGLAELQEVQSHPMALAQCREFFLAYPHIRLVESVDTAESAARISREQLRHTAAIGSTLAAERYGLRILAPAIETYPQNFTRFLALQKSRSTWHANGHNALGKASVCFTLPHQPGSLSQVLSELAHQGVNLTKIQSAPLLGRPGEYRFFVDFTAENLAPALSALPFVTREFELLGAYAVAEIPEETPFNTQTTSLS